MPETTSIPVRKAYWEAPGFRWILFGLFALVYLLNRSPHPGFDDGLGFMLDAETGFNFHTNATNHVLYNALQHILVSVFAFLPTALVLTVLPILCSLLTLHRIHRIGVLFEGEGIYSLLPVLVLGFSFTFWQQSEIIEVYAFNNLLFVHFLYFALRDLLAGHRRGSLWVSLFLGLGFLTHIQNILSIPFFLYYLLWRNDLSALRKLRGLLLAGGLFFLLFIPPLLGDMNSASAVFFDRQFRGNVMDLDLRALLMGAAKGLAYLVYNFHLFLPFIFHGWWRMWKDRRGVFLCLGLLLVPYLGFALKYNVNDNHVFFLVSYLLLVIPSVFSFEALLGSRHRYLKWLIPLMFLASPALYGGAYFMGKQTAFVARYDAEKAYKGGALHLLWPGKAWAKDPLSLAKEIHATDPGAFDRGEVEWNYPAALQLLRYRGEL